MSDKKEWALYLAALGFWVFRLQPNSKLPMDKGWQTQATRGVEEIEELWNSQPEANIGISTSKFGKDKALVVIDEDNKGSKKGAETLFQLDFAGYEIPITFIQTTPTGGRHHVYVCEKPLRQGGANILGNGLDVRSRGGYIVGSGSTLLDGAYTSDDGKIQRAPQWLLDKLSVAKVEPKKEVDVSRIDPDMARARAVAYLEDAPIAEEGSRNETAFRVICEIKDKGVDEDTALELIMEWNENNDPPMEAEEIEITVRSAYKTGQNPIGYKAPEVIFDEVEEAAPEPTWFDKINENHALVMTGGSHAILWERTDKDGKYKVDLLNEQSFHKMLSYKSIVLNKKPMRQTKVWIDDVGARRYEGLVFAPEQNVDARFFNLWRGFAVKPFADGEVPSDKAKRSLELFLEHAEKNVADGDPVMFKFLMCHFAHLVQRPWEKPLTALVFKGSKGVGKNALVSCIAMMLGQHAIITSKRRYLTSNFNSHFENCLMFVADEACWPGDKEAEGMLKDLITGGEHNIERKGYESYTVANLTRVYILGNEDWLAPATEDERRYGVFNVNENRKQDLKFFSEMMEGMRDGGVRLLLQYLRDWKIDININQAPYSKGLVDQKLASLDPFGQFWYDCLRSGELIGSSLADCDFLKIRTTQLRTAFTNYVKQRHISARLPSETVMGAQLKKYAASITKKRVFGAGYEYRSTGLAALRKDWEKYIKGEIDWPEDNMEDAFE